MNSFKCNKNQNNNKSKSKNINDFKTYYSNFNNGSYYNNPKNYNYSHSYKNNFYSYNYSIYDNSNYFGNYNNSNKYYNNYNNNQKNKDKFNINKTINQINNNSNDNNNAIYNNSNDERNNNSKVNEKNKMNNDSIHNNDKTKNNKNSDKNEKFDSFNEIYNKIFKLNEWFFKPINELIKNEIYKSLISIEKIKQDIFDIFDIKEKKDEDFYQKLFSTLRDSDIKKEELIIKFLNIINLYIKHIILSTNENDEVKKNATDYFINTISTFEFKQTLDFFENYISCFQIKDMLSKYYQIKENLIKNDKNIIYLVKIFDLQNIFSFQNFKLLKNNGINYPLINKLFNVYNKTENELLDLFNYIKSVIPKNSIPSLLFTQIYENNKMILNQQSIKLLIDNLLKIPKSNDQENYIKFYSFVINNKLDIYFPHFNKHEFLNELEYKFNCADIAISIIQTFNNKEIMSLNKSLLKEILYSTSYGNIMQVNFLLKYFPEEIDVVIKDYYDNNQLKYLKKLIREINPKPKLNNELKNEIIKIDKNSINSFYAFKVKDCFLNKFDLLIEFIRNQKEFEIFVPIFLEKIKNNLISIQKLSYLLKYGESKGFKFPVIRNREKLELIQKAKKEVPIKLSEDKFGPRTENCISYSKNDINVIFIKETSYLIKYFDLYFKNSKFIGIDSEWRESIEFINKSQVSIIQLSDFEMKNIFILDMIELKKEKNFEEHFEKLFINKKFIGFNFEGDLSYYPDKLNLFFREKVEIYDIRKLYSLKYKENCPTFSKVCEKLIGKPLCKYEQCSNWERRPLRESQLHYAALDSLLCCLIFKELTEDINC